MMGRLSGLIFAGALGFMPLSADAITTFDISGTVVGGSQDGAVGTGTVTFDESLLTGVNGETANPAVDPNFALSFMLFGQLFSALDDINFDDFPLLTVDAMGTPTDIDFVVDEADAVNPTDIAQAGITAFDLFGLTSDPLTGGFTTNISVTEVSAVPIPATLPLLLGGLLIGGYVVRRQKVA
jgi:hypothetical protein